MQAYPRFLFHKEHAPEGFLIATPDAEPTGEGWVDTPAAFDPAYQPPPPSAAPEGSIPEDARARGFVPVAYPSWRYDKDGNSLLVKTAADEAKADPAIWKHSPAHHDAGYTPDVAAPVDKDKATREFIAKAKELHATPVPIALKALEGVTDRAQLDHVKNLEMLNDEPRVGLVRAIDKQIAALPVPEKPVVPVRPVAPPPPPAASAQRPQVARVPQGLPPVDTKGHMESASAPGNVEEVPSA